MNSMEGPTILLSSGSYYNYSEPETSQMTAEDLAYGLGYTGRFRGQTRHPDTGNHAYYSVAQHCVLMVAELETAGYGAETQFDGLMHEVAEMPMGDFVGPAKHLVADFKAMEKRIEKIEFGRFGVKMRHKDLIKQYDLRMLATEKRDLMPAAKGVIWPYMGDIAPFRAKITPWGPDRAARAFLREYERLNESLSSNRTPGDSEAFEGSHIQ